MMNIHGPSASNESIGLGNGIGIGASGQTVALIVQGEVRADDWDVLAQSLILAFDSPPLESLWNQGSEQMLRFSCLLAPSHPLNIPVNVERGLDVAVPHEFLLHSDCCPHAVKP